MDFQVKQGSLALSPFECPTFSPFSVLPACFEGTGELRSCSQRLILDGKKMMQLKTMPRAALVTWKIVWSKPIPGKCILSLLGPARCSTRGRVLVCSEKVCRSLLTCLISMSVFPPVQECSGFHVHISAHRLAPVRRYTPLPALEPLEGDPFESPSPIPTAFLINPWEQNCCPSMVFKMPGFVNREIIYFPELGESLRNICYIVPVPQTNPRMS